MKIGKNNREYSYLMKIILQNMIFFFSKMKIGKNSIANIHFGRMKIIQNGKNIQIWIIMDWNSTDMHRWHPHRI